MVGAQLGQAVLQAGDEQVPGVVGRPDLGREKRRIARHAAFGNGSAYVRLVGVDLRGIDQAVAQFDGGSINAAAEHLGQTVSGISRALGRLERKLDTTLLRRTTRRLELTEEGRAFLAHARAILASIDEAEEQMAARRQKPAGRCA